MSKFYSLFSGSKGNCSYIENEFGGILIDASPSYKLITESLSRNSIDLEKIHAVFITHEHSDHVGALKVLTKKLKVPVFASEKVSAYLEERGLISPDTDLRPISEGGTYDIAGFGITPFKTLHDSVDCFGFSVQSGNSCLGYATDLGKVTPDVLQSLSKCDLVFLESNYDENMLICGNYNRLLKMRIMGEKGHLSNYDCAEAISKLFGFGVNRFVLAHLSEENNTPNIAEKETVNALANLGAKYSNDYTLNISSRNGLVSPIYF